MERINNMETKTSLLERISASAVNFGLGSLTLGLGTLYQPIISGESAMTPTDVNYPIWAGFGLITTGLVGGLIGSSRNGGTYN